MTEDRRVIDEAKEVLMARLGCSPEAALAVLVAQSERDGSDVRSTAAAVVGRARSGATDPDGNDA